MRDDCCAVLYVHVIGHVCHHIFGCFVCVLFYHMWAPYWLFPSSLCIAWWSSIFQPLYHMASQSPWQQPLTSRHIVICSTSHQSLMPVVAMWPYLSLWPCPCCLPVSLSVTRRLLGTNPSCHCRQWIMASNLSPFMTHASIDYQLHTQQTTPYTHSVPAAQWITAN